MPVEVVTPETTTDQPIPHGLPRFIEASISLVGLLIVTPLLLIAALAIKLASSGPVLFCQKRMGQNGVPFVLYKLRTMTNSNHGLQVTVANDARINPVGKILRKTKLDELPELWNVFKGDMSLVGPRPEVLCYVDLNNKLWRDVLKARPGITDPLTLRLRNEESLMEKVTGDHEEFYLKFLQPFKLKGHLDYLRQRSSFSDIKVLFQTVIAVVFVSKAPPLTVEEIKEFSHRDHRE